MTHRFKGITLAFVLALAAAMLAQEPPKNVCGITVHGPSDISRHTELVQVTCPNLEELSRLAGIPIAPGTRNPTQVLIHSKVGDSFIAAVKTASGEELFLSAVLYTFIPDPSVKAGMVVFDRDDIVELKVRVQADLP